MNRRSTGRIFLLWLLALLTASCGGLAGEPNIVSTMPPRPTSEPVAFNQLADINRDWF